MKNIINLITIIITLNVVTFSQTWQSFTTLQGLSDNQIRCLATDENGTVWIGTKTKGIQGYNGTNFISFPANSSLPTNAGSHYEITALNVIDGKIYIGVKSSATLGGLWIYNFATQAINYIGNFEIIGGMDIKVFYKAQDGTIYGGSGNGFYKRIADNNWQKIASGWVQSIAEKSNGLIYFTTFDSLYTYNGITKKGIKKGLFYSVAFGKNDEGYVSDGSDVYKFLDDNTFTPMGFAGYSKAMVKDKNGVLWIASAGSGFGIIKIDGNNITTYNTGNSPLLSTDLTAACVTPDNKKFFGHYSAGLNSLLDAPVIIPVSVSPTNIQLYVNDTATITISNGVGPYNVWVVPTNLGNLTLNNNILSFKALNVGTGKIYVSSITGTDTATVDVAVLSNQTYPKLRPTGFDVSKGSFPDKIEVKWVTPGEFMQGFEDGIPPTWKTNPEPNQSTSWVISSFQPYSGTKSVKFDVYSPGTPITDMLITEKIHISPEKPKFKFFIKTAYAFGNTYSSFIKLSTVSQDPSTFTTTLKELSPAYLADSNLIWRPVEINLTNFVNQDVFIAFECKAEDIIIYLDDLQLYGEPGLTIIGQNVTNYKLYRGSNSLNLQNDNNLIYQGISTNYIDNNITPLTNYYYGVSAVYSDNTETPITDPSFGIAYAQNDSLLIDFTQNSLVPTVDGQINGEEYSDAIKVILTRRGYFADAFLKVANNKLFIAVKAFADTLLSENDFVLFAFDKNRNFSYEEGTEGYYSLRKTATGIEKAFFPYTIFGFNQGIVNPDGFDAAIGFNNYPVYEMSLDFSTSLLNISTSTIIGAYLSVFNLETNTESSWLERLLAGEYSVSGFGSITFNNLSGVKEDDNLNIPTNFVLFNNYPNPFNPNTTIKFAIPTESFVNLAVYNSLGEKVSTLVNVQLKAGNYTYNFSAQNLSSGVYFYKLLAKHNNGTFEKTNKMILIK